MADSSAEPTLESKPEQKMNLLLPSQGELHLSKAKKFQETVILVPFYGAKKSSLQRHAAFLNALGYDAVIFKLKWGPKDTNGSIFTADSTAGFKHIWADQVEGILNAVAGEKIVFAFSNPCSGAIEAIVRRHATDVKGLICDSGPSFDLFQSLMNYFQYEEPIRWLPLRLAAAFSMSKSFAFNYQGDIKKDLDQLPAGFKILSIRGWKDVLISAQDIDRVFDPHTQLDWQRLSLPQAGHLNGLRDFKEEYAKPVALFLQSIATEI